MSVLQHRHTLLALSTFHFSPVDRPIPLLHSNSAYYILHSYRRENRDMPTFFGAGERIHAGIPSKLSEVDVTEDCFYTSHSDRRPPSVLPIPQRSPPQETVITCQSSKQDIKAGPSTSVQYRSYHCFYSLLLVVCLSPFPMMSDS
jgi:hypothetical protein